MNAAESHQADLIGRLVDLRQRNGLSQREVARRMGTVQSAVCDLELLRVCPRLSTLHRYAEAIGCTLRVEIDPQEGPR